MEVVVGADHAGYELKEVIKAYLKEKGYDVIDVGTDSLKPWTTGLRPRGWRRGAARRGRRGVLICGSGVGASIAANKIPAFVPPSATTRTPRGRASSMTT